MPIPDLGRLRSVDPREIWRNEAHDFTPWLLDNPDVLSDALGIDLELEASEHPVGTFSVDLLGRDLTNDAVLIIENQLDSSDHPHLGQVLTYAAGTDASTIVWIAPTFRQEHRQALDWLNERTDEETRFFGVQIGAVRIGDSEAAPLLEVVAKPNDWQKQVRAATRAAQVTGRGKLYLQFWELYLDKVRERHPDWTRAKPVPSNSLTSASRIRHAYLNPVFADRGRLAQMLWIDSGDADRNREIFETLEQQRTLVEEVFGESLDWDYMEGRKSCKVVAYTDGSIEKPDEYGKYIEWFIDSGERIRRALNAAEVEDWARR